MGLEVILLKGLMRRVDRFCALHPRFGVKNLMLYIVIGNLLVWLFSMMDTEEEKAEKEAEGKADQRERRLQDATLKIHGKYGKNALLRGTNFREGATTRERNRQIGGHRSGD